VRFHLTVDVSFEADDIDEALDLVARHFHSMTDIDCDSELEFLGSINMKPINPDEEDKETQ